MPSFSCVAGNSAASGLRLDRYFAENLKLLTRSQIKTRNLKASVNGREVKISRLIREGDKLDFFWDDPLPIDLVPENIPLDIIYDDDRVAVINKAQGMVVHPGAGNRTGTLANALYFRSLEKNAADKFITNNLRPGIVHRLDKDTSGLIITAWDEEAHFFLAEQFRQRKVIKTYAAIVRGCPAEKKGLIDMPIKRSKNNRKLFTADITGKQSLTFYQVVKSWGDYSLLLLRLKTGRTHQIRVHLKHLGNPIIGDPLYGKCGNPQHGKQNTGFQNQTLMLHAKRLSIILPDNKKKQTFRTSFPERFYGFFNHD